LQRVVPAANRADFWDHHKHEFAVYVANLPEEVNGCVSLPAPTAELGVEGQILM